MSQKTSEQIFAEQLRGRRRELGLTQRALAEHIGYSEKAVSKWEGGSATPPAALLPRIADLLHCTIDDLLRGDAEPCYYLGIDGGGTKTEFRLCDSAGYEISHALLGPSNPNDVGTEETERVLREGISHVCGNIPLRSISVFAGIAGGITGDNRRAIAKILKDLHFGRAGNGSDAQNAVAMALGEHNGTVVIAGTGSIAFSQKDGELYRYGGYGYLLEEGGSGFALGRDAIRAALYHESGLGEKTALYEAVRALCGRNTVGEALGTLYAGGKRAFAAFAPTVFEAHRKGDPVAVDLVRKNAVVIADLIRAAATPFGSDAHDVILVGGLTHHRDVLLPAIQEALGQDPRFNLHVNNGAMVNGALYLAGLGKEISSC